MLASLLGIESVTSISTFLTLRMKKLNKCFRPAEYLQKCKIKVKTKKKLFPSHFHYACVSKKTKTNSLPQLASVLTDDEK